jgi:hypothetical protein
MLIDTEPMTAAIGRRLRAITTRFQRSTTSTWGIYGLSTARHDSSHDGMGRNQSDAPANAAASSQAWLPIGPSCC